MAAIPKVCEFCHAPIPAEASFCPACATPVVGTPIPRATDPTAGGDATRGGPQPPPPAGFDEAFARGAVVDGKYDVLERLGSGGFGDVYRVRHRILQRDLALKTLHPSLCASPEMRARFFREAQVLMDLSHPNIVTLREAGEWRGRLYMVMDFLPGETLADLLAREKRLPARRAVALALPVLRALEAAHRQGVIHRDLKPANLILAPGPGSTDVKVLDFGIAKVIHEGKPEEQTGLTSAGVAIGTLKYMSPEQAGGFQIDGRADLYALGALLYEAITGRPPFAGENLTHLYKQVLLDPPASFRKLGVAEEVPGLEAFLQRVLAKDPQQRPADAAAMARELETLLAGKPRAAGRRESIAGAAAAIGAAVAALALVAWGLASARPRPLENSPPPVNGPADPIVESRPDILRHPDRVNDVAWSADGARIVTACSDGRVRLWNAANGRELRTLTGHVRGANVAAFRPDGAWVAGGGQDATVRVWDAETGAPIVTWEEHRSAVVALAFAPDGKVLASASDDGAVLLWDLDARKLLRPLTGHHRAVVALAFAPDGGTLASAGVENQVRLWDREQDKPRGLILAHARPITGLAFLDGGNALLSGSLDGFLKTWKLPERTMTRSLLGNAAGVSALAVDGARTRLAFSAPDHRVRVWDLVHAKELHSFVGHGNQVRSLAFRPDGRVLASASWDGTVRLWPVGD